MNQHQFYDLSPVQEQFWLQHQSDPEGSAYNMVSLFEISGGLDIEMVRLTLNALVDRHDSLRSRFENREEGLKSVVSSQIQVELDQKDFSEESLNSDIVAPFNLEKGPLFRFVLYRKEKTFILLFVFHHIIIDLRSKDIFGKEFSLIYNSFNQDKISDLSPSVAYHKYTDWFRDFSSSEKYGKMVDFWKGCELSLPPLKLTSDFERPPVPGTSGTRLSGVLSDRVYRNLESYCEKEGTSPFLVLISAYYLLLHKYSGQEKVSLGVPRTNRYDHSMENILGSFVNILPMVVDFKQVMTFRDLLLQVRKKMLLIHRNQHVPYTRVISFTKGERDRKFNPLFQAGFTSEHSMELSLDGLIIEPLPVPGHGSQLDLFFNFWERKGIFHWELEYNTELFAQERCELFISSYMTLMNQILEEKDFALDKARLLTDEWKQKVCLDWNDTGKQISSFKGVHLYFEEQVEKTPESTALRFRGESLSYGQLNKRANKLACLLMEKGAGVETIVGLSLERSFEMVIGMLGILKAGASYMPIEPSHPDEYKKYLVHDTDLKLLLTTGEYGDGYSTLFPRLDVILLDDEEAFSSLEKDVNPQVDISSDTRAYLFYTSGSTGKPKGVEVLHDGLTDRILWMDETFNFGRDRKTILKTPYNFDVSGMEFWLPLSTGAPLVIAEPQGHLDNSYLARIIRDEDISIAHFVPSLLNTFIGAADEFSCPGLKDVLCCGEVLPPSVVNEFYKKFPNSRLHNLYGPTEATIFITYWACENFCSVVPIGKPVQNTQTYVLDDNFNPLPPGVTGHLYLAGSGLARGYYKRDDLTKAVFVPHFNIKNKLIYKSGDLAQWTLRGDLLCFGRSDNQVQLHGQRIELGEVESTLNQHPGVEASAVIVDGEFGSDQRLVAYVVKSGQGVDIPELKSHILKTSPKYMVPSLFLFLDELPLSSNGKLDRKKLPQNKLIGELTPDQSIKVEGDTEEVIARIWGDLLSVPVGSRDNFFDLGGTSLQIMEVQRELVKWAGRDIPITHLFQYSTVNSLAEYLSREDNKQQKNAILSRVEKQKKRRKVKR
jgi:amino acid adenylation domain-containing protein